MKKTTLIVIVVVMTFVTALFIGGIFFVHDHPGSAIPLQTMASVLGTIFTAVTVFLALKVTQEISRAAKAAAKLSLASVDRERTEIVVSLTKLRQEQERQQETASQYGDDGWEAEEQEAKRNVTNLAAQIAEKEAKLEFINQVIADH